MVVEHGAQYSNLCFVTLEVCSSHWFCIGFVKLRTLRLLGWRLHIVSLLSWFGLWVW